MNELAVHIFRFLHFVGLASLLGGLFVQIRASEKQVSSYVLHGVYTQLITGIVLLILTMADANHVKVTVKLGILLIILIISLIRRKSGLNTPLFVSLIGLTLLNVGLAVFW